VVGGGGWHQGREQRGFIVGAPSARSLNCMRINATAHEMQTHGNCDEPGAATEKTATLARRVEVAQERLDRVTTVDLGIRHLVEDLDGHGF
jgi:hypothetical protein